MAASCGRALYVTAACAIAGVARRPAAPFILLLAAGLQWVDTAPLRHIIASNIATPPAQPISFAAMTQAAAAARTIRVLPTFACLPDSSDMSKAIALEMQLVAASAFVPVNTAYQSRHTVDCAAEQSAAELPRENDASFQVFLPELANYATLKAQAIDRVSCVATDRLILCGGASGPALRAASQIDPRWQPPSMTPWLEDTRK